MNVLLLCPMFDGQTGPAIKYAFEQLGCTVRAVDANRQPEESYTVACEFDPDLVFCSRTPSLTGQVAAIKKKFPSIVTCLWNVDAKQKVGHWKHIFPLIKICDYYFVVEHGQIPGWKEINPNTFWLPQGVQNEIYNKPKEITDIDRQKYICDVCFTGTSRPHRIPYLSAVAQMNVNYKKWGKPKNSLVYNEEHNKMVSLSKINLACTGPEVPELKGIISVRDFKILGAGGFLLEFYRDGLEKIFPENMKVVDYYRSPKELTEKIKYWLDKNHEWERWQIAERGYSWVHENATYTHRMRTALEYMGMA